MATLVPVRPGLTLLRLSLLVAAVGASATLFGFGTLATRTAYSYLTAFCFVASLAVGALLLLMLGYAVNAGWMSVIRRASDTVAIALVPAAVLFIPIALSIDTLYSWSRPDERLPPEAQHAVAHNQSYLNVPFFVARAALYFATWLVPALLLRYWSTRRQQAVAGDPLTALHRERGLSAAMLLPTTLAMTFCAFDWMMSLEPDWFSSSYGMYFLNGGVLAALATITILCHFGERGGSARNVITPNHFHALGRCLFAFTILWTYVAYFQLFLIFITDKPREVSFYLLRAQGSWKSVGPLLAVGHFVIPVLLLAPRAWKLHSGFLAGISAWLLLMHYADIYYLIMPVASPGRAAPVWTDAGALMLVVGTCSAFCAWLQRGRTLIAEHDPLLATGMHYRSDH